MKQLLSILIIILFFNSCKSSNLTSFWVANNSQREIELHSSVISSSLGGPQVLSRPFVTKPGDVIELGAANYNQEMPISHLFNYNISGNEENLNDPMDISNWIKTTDKKGKPMYILYLASR